MAPTAWPSTGSPCTSASSGDSVKDPASATVAILNGYSADNIGDWLLIEASVDLVRARHPGEHIVVLAMDPRSLSPRIVGAEVIEAPISLERPPWIAIMGVLLAYITACRFGPRRMRRLSSIRSAYSVGGGFLQVRSMRELGSVFAVHITQLLLMRRRRVPIVMLPQSVGPFRGRIPRFGARRVLRAFEETVVREEQSLEHLRALDTSRPHRVHQTADLAFWPGLRRRDVRQGHTGPADGQALRVALVTRQWWFPGAADPDGEQDRYLANVACLIDLLSERGHTPVMVLHSTGPTVRGDDGIATSAIGRLTNTVPPIDDLSHHMSLDDVEAHYAGFDVVISTRLHAALMALRAGVPAIALGYEWKSEGIFGDLGLARWHRKIDAWAPGEVAEMVTSLADYPLDRAHGEMARMGKSVEDLFLRTLPVSRSDS